MLLITFIIYTYMIVLEPHHKVWAKPFEVEHTLNTYLSDLVKLNLIHVKAKCYCRVGGIIAFSSY